MQHINSVLVIGNGFDLDLGLKTHFKDFFSSNEYHKLQPYIEIPGSLAEYLSNQYKLNHWFDVEEAMASYVKEKEKSKDFNCVLADKYFLNELKSAFWDYVCHEVLNIASKQSLAKELIKKQNRDKCFDKIYSFNCFDCTQYDFASWGEIENLNNVVYVHNYLDKFILGVSNYDSKDNNYSFLQKNHQQGYPVSDIEKFKEDLLNADNVVIFGHSLNRIDMVYFKDLFWHISQSHCVKKNIFFITKDNQSAKIIKDNISDHAILFSVLESSCNISFIYTEKCKSIKDVENFESILNIKNR